MVNSVVSLFSGCGGFDAGFSKGAFEVVEAHDVDCVAVDTYNANHAPVCRVTDLRTCSLKLPAADVIIAGPPCQGFSTIGNLKRDDERNALLMSACNIVGRRKPKLFILENVMGLATARNHHLLLAAINALTDYGYFVEMVSVRAEDLGLPQRRRRLLLFARRGKKPFNIKLPLNAGTPTVFDALSALKGPLAADSLILAPNSKARLIAEKIKPGQKLCNVRESPAAVHTWDIPEVFGFVSADERRLLNTLLRLRRTERERDYGDADPVPIRRLRAAIGARTEEMVRALCHKGYIRRVGRRYDLVHTFNGNYRRLRWDEPSPTVDTHFGDPRLFLHPEKHRGMSVGEAAALQGFAPKFIWPTSRSAAFRLIGNAVPPPISKAVSAMARDLLL